MSEKDIEQMRSRFAREAMALMERTGKEVTRTRLAAELKIARARLDAVFPKKATCSKRSPPNGSHPRSR